MYVRGAIVRAHSALPSVGMGFTILLSVVPTQKGLPALEYQSPSKAQMPGCKPLLRPLLYRLFPSLFLSHVRACRGRTCWLRSPELWRCPRRVLASRSQGRYAGRAKPCGVAVILLGELEWVVDVGRYVNKICRGSLPSSSLEALVSGDRGERRVMSVSNVFVFFRYLLWKAKPDLSALSEGFESDLAKEISRYRGSYGTGSCGLGIFWRYA